MSQESTMSETPVTPTQLKTFLNEAPLMFKSKLHRGAEKLILTNCYRSLWCNDLALMQKYFFKEGLSDSENLAHLLEKYQLFGSSKDRGQETDEPEYWESQRGKQCGHLFKKGESVYRCRNCGLDDTCVMCSKCFHATDHEGHDVKIWISRGAGGCCDCGDPEAWKVALNCSIHTPLTSAIPEQQPSEPISSIPASITNSVRDTLQVVLDYILETFATSPEDVVSSPRDVGVGAVTAESIQQDCVDSHEALGLPKVDLSTQKYACVLWNDEKHSFDAVIKIVRDAIGCTKEEASHAAECVDIYGRHIIKESQDVAELIQVAKTISTIHLAVTISSVEKIVREEIAGLLLDWLKELTGGRYKFFDRVDGGNCIIRDVICQVLSEDWALRPELATLSTRSRRSRMPEDEDDDFDPEGDEDIPESDNEDMDMIFEQANLDMHDISDDMLLDEDEIDEFFHVEEGDEFEVQEESEGASDDDDDDDDDAEEDIVTEQDNDINTTPEDEQQDQHQPSITDDQVVMAASQPVRRRASGTAAHPNTSPTAEKRRRLSNSSQSKKHKPRDILDMDWSLDQWLEHTEKLEANERVIAKQRLGIPYNQDDLSATRRVHANIKKEFRRKLRLDYLLQFDLRLWKVARISIKDLLIGTFISNFQYRPVLGVRFARNYPELVDAFFFKDREPENSVSTLSVQLLTVPTVASMLVRDFKFFGIVCSILQNFFLTDRIYMNLPENQGFEQSQVDCTAKAIARHRYAYTIFDLRYVMNAEPVRLEVSKNPVYLGQFINMVYQFQAMDPLQRQTDTHVEYESQSWVAAFNMTLQTSKLCRLLAGCFDALPSSDISATESTRNLVRSIYRVLKAITDWDPHLPPHKEGAHIDNRVIIQGFAYQRCHVVKTPNAGSYMVVAYDVTKDPVSFHHPYHWLLSELFENVSLLHQSALNELGYLGGFKQMVYAAFQNMGVDAANTNQYDPLCKGLDCFLMVLEYPIRTLVVLSQINCGVWVRNGYAIRNMSHSYRDVNVRENTLDCDIYLLQVGFAVCDSDQILLTLIDRFQLTDWFNGKPEKKSAVYDASQKTFMVEEFLNLLIIAATEHNYAAGATIEQRIRQSIVQFLGISSMAYSELLKLIPESLTEHESFETQLNVIANFKAPDGLSDKGLYEIKPEFLDEIDPYFWHYTRNQREEAHNVLKKRWNQLNPDNRLGDKEEFLLLPKSSRIEVGPFRHGGQFLHSQTLCQIIVYALWDAKFRNKSDAILDETLYLAMLAVTDPNNAASELAAMNVKGKYRADVLLDEASTKNFIQHAETDEYSIQVNEIEKTHATLLVVLLRCLDDSKLSHAHKRLMFVVDKIEAYGSDTAKERISEYKERKQKEAKADMEKNAGGGLTEYERKRATVKARQAAIMSQFASAQSKFMEQHSALYDTVEFEDSKDTYEASSTINNEIGTEEEEDVEVVRKCHFPADTCIVCQDELDDSKLFGTLGLIQRTHIQRYAVMDNKDVLSDILRASNYENPWVPRQEQEQEQQEEKEKEEQQQEEEVEQQQPFVGFPTDAHISGLDISSCGHLMHQECFDTYTKSVDNQVLSELIRLSPFALAPKSRFLCPLCKALGNVLVPVVWKGKKESYPGVMAPCTPYADLSKTLKETIQELVSTVDGQDDDIPFTNTDPDVVICDMDKLKHIYNKLMRVVHTTLNDKPAETSLDLLTSIRDLYDMYSYTIADFEVAQRGTEGTRARDLTVEHTGTFIDDVPAASQTFLKILGMTNMLIPSMMDSPWQTDNRHTTARLALESLAQLIPSSFVGEKRQPILLDDPFRVLVRLSLSVTANPAVEVHHLLRLIYIAELTKIVIVLVHSFFADDKWLKSPLLASLNANQQATPGSESVQQYANFVLGLLKVSQDKIDTFFKAVTPGAFVALVRTFALPFLRKALFFLVVHDGFIPQNPTDDTMLEKTEFESLLETLKLPALVDIFVLEAFEQELIGEWCTDYINSSSKDLSIASTKPLSIKLNLPTQFKMATLPYRLDQLLDESSKRVCRKCKTVPEHSAICLICGMFVCARQFCCTEGTKGECNTHVKRCGGEIGIYLMIKDCFLLLLHDNGGSIMNAPYLDSHGEADIFFKRGAPQYLNAKRYEQIRQMWLNQSIPAFVRRRMEIAYSATIWEAF